MYEETYGTDWESITLEEGLERTFALGVMRALGSPLPDEYNRILADTQNAYERSLLEMAYNEGYSRYKSYDGDGLEDAWDDVLDAELVVESVDDQTEWTPTSSRPTFLDVPSKDERPSKIELPKFLFR